jgi:cytochrome b subunit of formate dehydrogenase
MFFTHDRVLPKYYYFRNIVNKLIFWLIGTLIFMSVVNGTLIRDEQIDLYTISKIYSHQRVFLAAFYEH